jgi:hypothetical protein
VISDVDLRGGAVCLACGSDNGADFDELCEDCHLSDCAYCGVTTHGYLLSANLACADCEGGMW